MELVLEYIKNNYLIFTIISVVLILALIGYLVDAKTSRDIKIKKPKNKELKQTNEEHIDTI